MRVRIIVGLIMGLFFNSSCNRNIDGIIINGRLDSAEGTNVKITSMNHKVVYDSVIINNHEFQFATRVPKEDFYYLRFSNDNSPDVVKKYSYSKLIYLEENSVYSFSSTGPKALEKQVYSIKSDSETQQELDKFLQIQNNAYWESIAAINHYVKLSYKYLADGDDLTYKKMIDSIYIADDQRNKSSTLALNRYLSIARPSVVVPYMINTYGDFFEYYSAYKKAMDSLDEKYSDNFYSKKVYESLNSYKLLRKGKEIPQIVGNDINGKPFSYDFSKNDYTLVNVWAAWSPNSRQENLELKKIYNSFKGKGFDIVGVSLDSDFDGWVRISKYDQIPWYQVSEGLPIGESKNVKTFKAKHLPVNYLLDGDKQVIRKNIEMEDLEEFLKKELGEE